MCVRGLVGLRGLQLGGLWAQVINDELTKFESERIQLGRVLRLANSCRHIVKSINFWRSILECFMKDK